MTNTSNNNASEISNSIHKSDYAFSTLIDLKSVIPDKMKVKIFKALEGCPLPTLQEWTNFLHFEFYLKGFDNLNGLGYSLSKDEIQLLKDCDCFVEILACHTMRDYIGWGIPTEENIQSIISKLQEKESKGLLEIGCGSGYWSAILKNRLAPSIEVQACEINLRADTPKPKFFNALDLDANEAMKKFPNFDILLVWPDINKVGNEVIDNMKPGQLLILETSIEVTANKGFYKNLDMLFDLKDSNDSIAFSGSLQKTFFLEKRITPKSELENTHFFENQYKPFLTKFKKKK